MSKSDIYNLIINRNEDILDNEPIMPRCYEVTCSESSNSIWINIDSDEDKSKTLYKGNGLCGRWCYENNKYILFFQVNIVSKTNNYDEEKKNNEEIRRLIPLIINSIRKTEEDIFNIYKYLDDAEIFIKFYSLYDDLFKVENWGNIKSYINNKFQYKKVINKQSNEGNLIDLQNKINMQNKLILNFIASHIELHLYPNYGKNIKFLIRDINILSMSEKKEITAINGHYELVVSVKVLGKIELEEILLNIIVKENRVLIKTIV